MSWANSHPFKELVKRLQWHGYAVIYSEWELQTLSCASLLLMNLLSHLFLIRRGKALEVTVSHLHKKMVPEKLLQDCFSVWCLREPCSLAGAMQRHQCPQSTFSSSHLFQFFLFSTLAKHLSLCAQDFALVVIPKSYHSSWFVSFFLWYSAISSPLFWYSFLLLLLFIKSHYFCQTRPTACCTILHNFIFLRTASHIFIFTFSFCLWSITVNNPGVMLQAQYVFHQSALFLCIGSFFSSFLPSFLLNRMYPPSPQSDIYSLWVCEVIIRTLKPYWNIWYLPLNGFYLEQLITDNQYLFFNGGCMVRTTLIKEIFVLPFTCFGQFQISYWD